MNIPPGFHVVDQPQDEAQVTPQHEDMNIPPGYKVVSGSPVQKMNKTAMIGERDQLFQQGETQRSRGDLIGQVMQVMDTLANPVNTLVNQPARLLGVDDVFQRGPVGGGVSPEQITTLMGNLTPSMGLEKYLNPIAEQLGVPPLHRQTNPDSVGAGLSRLATPFANMLLDPDILLQLTAGVNPVGRALFAGQMAKDVPEQVMHVSDVIQSGQGTAADITEAVGQPLLNTLLARSLANHSEPPTRSGLTRADVPGMNISDINEALAAKGLVAPPERQLKAPPTKVEQKSAEFANRPQSPQAGPFVASPRYGTAPVSVGSEPGLAAFNPAALHDLFQPEQRPERLLTAPRQFPPAPVGPEGQFQVSPFGKALDVSQLSPRELAEFQREAGAEAVQNEGGSAQERVVNTVRAALSQPSKVTADKVNDLTGVSRQPYKVQGISPEGGYEKGQELPFKTVFDKLTQEAGIGEFYVKIGEKVYPVNSVDEVVGRYKAAAERAGTSPEATVMDRQGNVVKELGKKQEPPQPGQIKGPEAKLYSGLNPEEIAKLLALKGLKERLVTMRREDGTEYPALAHEQSYDFGNGPIASIGKLNERGEITHGIQGKNEKLIEVQPPAEGTSQALARPVKSNEVSIQSPKAETDVAIVPRSVSGKSLKNLLNVYFGRTDLTTQHKKYKDTLLSGSMDDLYPSDLRDLYFGTKERKGLKPIHEERLQQAGGNPEKRAAAVEVEDFLFDEITARLFSRGLEHGENVVGASKEVITKERDKLVEKLQDSVDKHGRPKLLPRDEAMLTKRLRNLESLLKQPDASQKQLPPSGTSEIKLHSGLGFEGEDIKDAFLPASRMLLRNPEKLKFNVVKDGKVDGGQLVNRLINLTDPSERKILENAGIREKFPSGEKVTLGQVDGWIKENSPEARVVTYGMEGKVSEAKKEYDKMTHEWYEPLNKADRQKLDELLMKQDDTIQVVGARNKTTGEVTSGNPGEIHAMMMDRTGLDYAQHETGYVTKSGRYVGNSEAQNLYGVGDSKNIGRNKLPATLEHISEQNQDEAIRYAELAGIVKNEPRDASPRATSHYSSVSALPTNEPMPEWTATKSGKNVQRVDVVIPRKEVGVERSIETSKYKVTPDDIEYGPKGEAYEQPLWQPDNLHENLPNTLGWAMIQYKTLPEDVINMPTREAIEKATKLVGKEELRKLAQQEVQHETGMVTPDEALAHATEVAARRVVKEKGGKRVAVIAEAQSRWGQSVREAKARDIKEGRTQPLRSLDGREITPDHPLLRDYNRLILKAAIEQARKEGATHIVVSDAETAMMTEKLDDKGLTSDDFATREEAEQFAKQAQGKTARTTSTAVYGDTGVGMHILSGEEKGWRVQINPDDASQLTKIPDGFMQPREKGFRFNYDTALPKIAEELTGSKGEKVSLGEHKNAYEKYKNTDEDQYANINATPEERAAYRLEQTSKPRSNLIFRNADGTPKTDVSGRLYPLDKISARLATGVPMTQTGKLYSGLGIHDMESVKKLADQFGKLLSRAQTDRETLRVALSSQGRQIKDLISAKRDAVDNAPLVTQERAESALRLEAQKQLPGGDPSKLLKAAVMYQELNGDRGGLAEARSKSAGNKEVLDALDYAEKNWEKIKPVVAKADAIDAMNLRMAKDAGLNLPSKDFYAKRLYDTGVRGILFPGERVQGVGKNSQLERKFPTIFDAIKAGHKPLSIDLAALVGKRTQEIQLDVNLHTWTDAFKKVNYEGQPVVADMRFEAGKQVAPTKMQAQLQLLPKKTSDGKSTIIKLRPGETTAPAGYSVLTTDRGNNLGISNEVFPELQAKLKLAEKAPDGYLGVTTSPGKTIAVLDGFHRIFKTVSGESTISGNLPGQALMQTLGAVKHGSLAFDAFHLSRIAQFHQSLSPGGSYRNGLSLLEYSKNDLAEAHRQGLISDNALKYANEKVTVPQGTFTRQEVLSSNLRNGLMVGKHSEALYTSFVRSVPLLGSANKFIFDKFSRGAIVDAAQVEFERVAKDNPTWTADRVSRAVSRDLNFRLGNIGRQGLVKNKTFQDALTVAFLAPKWVEAMAQSEARSVGQQVKALNPLSDKFAKRPTLLRSTSNILAMYFLASQVANYATTGHSTFDNEEGHKLDTKVGGMWFSPFTIGAELLHDVIRYTNQGENPIEVGTHIARNKESGASRAVDILATGETGIGKLHDPVDRLKAAGAAMFNPTPLPIRQGVRAYQTDDSAPAKRQAAALFGLKGEPETRGDRREAAMKGKGLKDRVDYEAQQSQELDAKKKKLGVNERIDLQLNAGERARENEADVKLHVNKEMSKPDRQWAESRGLMFPGYANNITYRGHKVILLKDEQVEMEKALVQGYTSALGKLKPLLASLPDDQVETYFNKEMAKVKKDVKLDMLVKINQRTTSR